VSLVIMVCSMTAFEIVIRRRRRDFRSDRERTRGVRS